MAKLKIGDAAPDFLLPGSDGRPWRLSGLRGQPVVLNFYPGDMSMTCTKQLCTYTEAWDDLNATDAVVLGISKQGLESKERFVAKYDLKVPLLADIEGIVARAYGVDAPMGFTKRATFVIDAEGVIRWIKISITTLSFAKPDELIEQVRSLQSR